MLVVGEKRRSANTSTEVGQFSYNCLEVPRPELGANSFLHPRLDHQQPDRIEGLTNDIPGDLGIRNI